MASTKTKSRAKSKAPKAGSTAKSSTRAAKAGKTSAKVGKTSAKVGKTSAKAGKTSAKVGKTAAKAGKTSAKVGKSPTKVGKTSTRAGKTAAKVGKPAAKAGKSAAKVTDVAGGLPDVGALKVPKLPEVELTAPKHTGRKMGNQGVVLRKIEQRLKLAWFFRKDLDARLPGKSDFHARAWSAFRTLDEYRTSTGAVRNGVTRDQALAGLVDAIGLIRSIVTDTTRAGDPLRKAFRFDVQLRPDRALFDVSETIVNAAAEHQDEFPAITDELITRARSAYAEAADLILESDELRDKRTATRAAGADLAQLATDVLLDGIDHLRAAARSAFLPGRPLAASYFIEALEPNAQASTDETKPTTDETKPTSEETPES